MKAIVVEDHSSLKELVKILLMSEKLTVDTCETGYEFLKKIEEEKYDVIILDINLPDIDGITICKLIKKNKEKYGYPIVIMLTAESSQEKINKALNEGATDYIKKPFNKDEFKLRIRNHLMFRKKLYKKHIDKDNKDGKIEYGNLILDTENYQLMEDNEIKKLTLKEYKVLEYLILRQGTVLSRNEIMEKIWEEEYSGSKDRTIDINICRLKKKIKTVEENLESIRGVGYFLKKL